MSKIRSFKHNSFCKKMKSQIQLKLFATLHEFEPPSSGNYSIEQGISIRELLEQLKLPPAKAKLIFINGIKADLNATLKGGDRVGIFPPVGGG
jgi:molybdopterin synthase sulfur carrier subunit